MVNTLEPTPDLTLRLEDSPLEMLQRLGQAWVTALTCLTGNDQWQLRIESHPAPRWDEHFSYTYRGSLASVVTRAYAGEPDDGALDGEEA